MQVLLGARQGTHQPAFFRLASRRRVRVARVHSGGVQNSLPWLSSGRSRRRPGGHSNICEGGYSPVTSVILCCFEGLSWDQAPGDWAARPYKARLGPGLRRAWCPGLSLPHRAGGAAAHAEARQTHSLRDISDSQAAAELACWVLSADWFRRVISLVKASLRNLMVPNTIAPWLFATGCDRLPIRRVALRFSSRSGNKTALRPQLRHRLFNGLKSCAFYLPDWR